MKVMNYSLPMEPIKLNQGRIANFGVLPSNAGGDYAPEYMVEVHVRPDSDQQPRRPANKRPFRKMRATFAKEWPQHSKGGVKFFPNLLTFGTTMLKLAHRKSDFIVKRGRFYVIGETKFRCRGVQTEIADLTYVVTVILKTLGAKDDPVSRRYLGDVLSNLSQGKVPHTPELTESSAPVPDPLAAARARGRQYAAQEYESPDSLTLLDARNYAGRNERSINEERQQGKLYALLPAGKSRGFRYPKWQFDAEAARLRVALQPFVDAGSNCWTIHSFMMRKHSALDGKSPKDIVLDGSADIRRVVELANREINGEQGAA
jgi:hypothetical protein